MPNKKTLDKLERDISADDEYRTPSEYSESQRRIREICILFTWDTNGYDPNRTIDLLNEYVHAKEKLPRILYSQITNYLFNLDVRKKEQFITNVENLLFYTLESPTCEIEEDVKKIIVKIYDHTQLVNYQMEKIDTGFGQNFADAKIDLSKEISKEVKGIEKEHITILGIFAAIVLTFVGTLTFSTSVLENISRDNIVGLSLAALIIGLVMFNLIAYLIDFLKEINGKIAYDENGKKAKNSYRRGINAIIVCLIVVMLIAHVVVEIKTKV